MMVQFVLYGLLGWGLEIVWTGLGSLLPPTDWRLVGKTYLWMFPIYGGCAVLLQNLVPVLEPYHWVLRGLVWIVVIFVFEFTTGGLVRALAGVCPWDYSAARLSFCGLIRWDYAPLWFVLGLAFERLSRVVASITPGVSEVLARFLAGT